MASPSTKKAGVASPKRGNKVKEPREWREHVVDTLEVANAEHQAARTQLAAVARAIEYISEVVYHHFVANWEGSDGE